MSSPKAPVRETLDDQAPRQSRSSRQPDPGLLLRSGLGNRTVVSILQRDLVDGGEVTSSPDKGAKKTKAKKKTGATTTPVTEPVTDKKWTADEIKRLKTAKTSGINTLIAIAGYDTKNGMTLLKTAGDWPRVLKDLPVGMRISEAGRDAMATIIAQEALGVDDASSLFKKRFRHDMTAGTGGTWTTPTIARVWKQLDLLPEADVSKNTILSSFRAVSGSGGMFRGGVNAIDIGQDSDEKHMAHTVRHEVGHGVHAQIASVVNKWLKDGVKMWWGALDKKGIDEFVAALGGYPAKFDNAGTEEPFDEDKKSFVRDCIASFTGAESWDPTHADGIDLPTPDDGHNALRQAVWDAMPAALKNALAQSTSHWYTNYANFQVGTGGDRYFVNHWYHRWYKMSSTAKKVVDDTGEDYSAMSEMELFANAYAEYFADPEGKKDPTKWGGKLAAPEKEFFSTCIVGRDPYSKYAKQQKKKKTTK